MSEPNDHLRRARERVESSQSGQPLTRVELAELVNTWVHENTNPRVMVELNENYIGKLERGTIRWPQVDCVRLALCTVLGVGTAAELGFRRPRRSIAAVAPADRKTFLQATIGVATGAVTRTVADLLPSDEPAPVPTMVGRREIDKVRTIAELFGTWDHTYGGGLVREAVAAQLRYSAELLEARCPEKLRNDLFGAVGFLGHTAGFMAFDAYAHGDARRMFDFALSCAEAAGNWHLRAKVLSSMARQAIWRGQADDGLTLVELAMVRADRLTATERAMLLAARARALAKLGRIEETAATVEMADQEFSNSEPSCDPPWMRYYDAAQHVGDTGHALFDTAMSGRFITEASSRLASAVAGHTSQYARSRAISGIKLASLKMHIREPDEAVAVGLNALTNAHGVHSRRAADDLHELDTLAAPYRSMPEVAQLQHEISELVRLL